MSELTFNKAKALIDISIKKKWVYRFDYFGWACTSIIIFLVQYFLWKSLFAASGKAVISGFTFSSMILYYFLVHIVINATHSNFDEKIAYLVHKGKMINYLKMPLSFMKSLYLENIGSKFIHLIFIFPLLTLIASFLISDFMFKWINFGLFLLSVLISNFMIFFYIFIFGCAAFWLKQYFGLQTIRQGITYFLSGGIIPLIFFPAVAQKIFSFLPFQYFLYFPIQLYLGSIPIKEIPQHFVVQLIWLIILYLLAKLVWKKAQIRYSEAGT